MTRAVNIKSNLSILSWPFGLFIMPMALAAIPEQRKRARAMNQSGEREDVKDSWISREICLECEEVTDHLFLLFVDEPVVESECQSCKVLRVHPDRGE